MARGKKDDEQPDNIKDINDDDKRLDQGKSGNKKLDDMFEAWRDDVDGK